MVVPNEDAKESKDAVDDRPDGVTDSEFMAALFGFFDTIGIPPDCIGAVIVLPATLFDCGVAFAGMLSAFVESGIICALVVSASILRTLFHFKCGRVKQG